MPTAEHQPQSGELQAVSDEARQLAFNALDGAYDCQQLAHAIEQFAARLSTPSHRTFEDGFEAAKKAALAALNEAAVGLPSKGEGPLYEAYSAIESLSRFKDMQDGQPSASQDKEGG